MIKAIGFDYGGVLNFSKSALPGIAEIIGMDRGELAKEYIKNNRLANVGNMSYEDLWAKILTDLGHGDKAQAAADHIHKVWDYTVNPQMLELIDKLRAHGYKTGLLSNNTTQNGDLLRNEGLDKYFDAFIISAEIGFQKPEPEAFQVLFDKLEVQPSELVFIDDSATSLRLAEQIGYTPILFTSYEQLVQEFEKLDIKF